jgi:hypothetical protein
MGAVCQKICKASRFGTLHLLHFFVSFDLGLADVHEIFFFLLFVFLGGFARGVVSLDV